MPNGNHRIIQTDLQLCADIKLNLANKEISTLMNITDESVNTHRYRLRKKLNLVGEQTQDDFVHNLITVLKPGRKKPLLSGFNVLFLSG